MDYKGKHLLQYLSYVHKYMAQDGYIKVKDEDIEGGRLATFRRALSALEFQYNNHIDEKPSYSNLDELVASMAIGWLKQYEVIPTILNETTLTRTLYEAFVENNIYVTNSLTPAQVAAIIPIYIYENGDNYNKLVSRYIDENISRKQPKPKKLKPKPIIHTIVIRIMRRVKNIS